MIEGGVSQVPQEIVDKAKGTLRHLEIGALIIVGGDGSLTTGLQLYDQGSGEEWWDLLWRLISLLRDVRLDSLF